MTSRSGNRSGTSIKLAALFAFLAILLMVQPAGADTITFTDTTDTITVGVVGSQTNVTEYNSITGLPGSCATEVYQCYVIITSPTTATTTSSEIGLNISEAGVDPTVAVSDYVIAYPNSTSYVVYFASDSPGDLFGLSPVSATPTPGLINESGGVQTAFTLSWSDGSTDTIKFQSDLDTVPEPASLILLGSGLLGLAGSQRKKLLKKG